MPDQQLSPHFLLSELLHSDTAAGNGIPNDPQPYHIENLRRLCVELLEPLRLKVGIIHVNSGFRSHTLNAIRGGSKSSAHMEGFAADIVPKQCSRRTLFNAARQFKFDQIIWEVTWTHVGLEGPNGVVRRQVEMAFPSSSGVIAYEAFESADPRVAA